MKEQEAEQEIAMIALGIWFIMLGMMTSCKKKPTVDITNCPDTNTSTERHDNTSPTSNLPGIDLPPSYEEVLSDPEDYLPPKYKK